MPTMPPGLPVGTVQGRFLFVNQDQADANTDPDYTLIDGTVRFTCSAKRLLVAGQDLTVIPLVFEAVFDSEGWLTPLGDTAVVRGIKLPATDAIVYNPTGFTWKVDFNIRDANTGNAIKIDSFSIEVPTDTTVQLADVTPVGSSGGVQIIRGEQGYSIDGVTRDDRTLIFSLNDPFDTSIPGVDIGPAIDDAVLARVFPSGIALDLDGVPYILPGANDVHVLFDTDGVPYWAGA